MNFLFVVQVIAAATSAPISHIHYDIAADSTDVAQRSLGVATTFDVDGPGQVVLALPGWTPGAYEMSWFARWVNDLTVTTSDGKPLTWDKVDYQTWRIEPAGAKSIKVSFRYEADTLDNAMSWTGHDFVLFNGTNVFLYPVGREMTSPTVTVHTHTGWRIATGMAAGTTPGSYTAPNYHDLVDMPFFVGQFDIDSVRTVDRWVRLVSYPVGVVTPERRRVALNQIAKVIPPEVAVFHETPWTSYTVMEIADSTFGGASGLRSEEHTS